MEMLSDKLTDPSKNIWSGTKSKKFGNQSLIFSTIKAKFSNFVNCLCTGFLHTFCIQASTILKAGITGSSFSRTSFLLSKYIKISLDTFSG